MIEKISSVQNKQYTPKRDNKSQTPSFGGLGDGIIYAVQLCEKYPMVNVSALDLSTAIVPRTIIETKESNAHAGFEAFRREFSGLFVNCLIPSFIVMGLAHLMQRPIMGPFGKKSNLAGTWANSDAIDKIHHFYGSAKGNSTAERVENTFRNMFGSISGADADKMKKFSDIFDMTFDSNGNVIKVGNEKIDKAIKDLTNVVMSKDLDKKVVKNAYQTLVQEAHIAENIRFKNDAGFFANNLESVCDDTVKMLRGVVKENITNQTELAQYFKKAKHLVNWKSIGGLGLIIPLAISMQPINRWITRKTSGQKGAPIYKDFGKETAHKEPTAKEKHELLAQKFISIGSMIGVAGLSMLMDKPSLKMFQFKGLFPTMDQARIISTATFASRMGAAEDKNELREATVRDIATFSSFYFLGDYVAKGIATLLQRHKKDAHLINVLKERNPNANALEKFWHWAKHTAIKSSDELVTVKDKRLRTMCQIGSIVFSLLSLGVFIPLYTRAKTNKKHAEELAKMNAEATSATSNTSGKDFSMSLLKDKTAFRAFTDSQGDK